MERMVFKMLKIKYGILTIVAFILWTLLACTFAEERYKLLTREGCGTLMEYCKKKGYIKQ